MSLFVSLCLSCIACCEHGMPAWKNYLAGIVLGKRYYFLEIIRTTSFSIGQVYFSTIGHLPKLKYCVFSCGNEKKFILGKHHFFEYESKCHTIFIKESNKGSNNERVQCPFCQDHLVEELQGDVAKKLGRKKLAERKPCQFFFNLFMAETTKFSTCCFFSDNF